MQSGMSSRAAQPERLASNQQPEVSNWRLCKYQTALLIHPNRINSVAIKKCETEAALIRKEVHIFC